MQFLRKKKSLWTVPLGLGIFSVCQVALTEGQLSLFLNTQSQVASETSAEEFQNLQSYDPTAVRVFSGGHLPAVVDTFWLRFLQDDLRVKYPSRSHSPSFFQIEALQKLDIYAFEPPLVTAMYLSVARDDFDGALILLSRAEHVREHLLPSFPKIIQTQYWSHSWAIPMTLGYVYLFDFQDLRKAAVAYETAASIPGVPEFVKSLARRFESPEGRRTIAERVVKALEPQAERNPILAERLRARREKLLRGEL